MPEAPDLEVVKEFLESHAVGTEVRSAKVLNRSVLRSLDEELLPDIEGRVLEQVRRRGKFLLIHFSGDRVLAVNPMLSGAFQFCAPSVRVMKRTCLTLSLSGERELRYLDDRQMGQVHYVKRDRLHEVPRLGEQGPDVLDDHPFDEFKRRLKPFHGEIKGILTRGRVISGIGNAYADEVLFAAGLYPFRKRKSLTDEELRRVLEKSRQVVEEAILVLRRRMGDEIHVKIRDFLKVHNKGGQPCPRCGNSISQLTANRRITSYCRRCQPGMLIRN